MKFFQRKYMFELFVFCLLALPLPLLEHAAEAQVARIKRPKLVLVLVIDQFRPDLLRRHLNRFLPATGGKGKIGGFRYLMEKGAYFPFAEYGLIQNMTCPGHATILSGAYAYQHGIAINDWIDGYSGKSTYCVQDDKEALVGPGLNANRKGISPRNFQGSTFGDELKNSGYSSQSITIALKDRAAVLMGGYRNDLALWYDTESASWISSRYYLPSGTLPSWVTDLNASINQDISKSPELIWSLPQTAPSGTSILSNKEIVSYQALESFGKEFPHKALKRSVQSLMTPYGTSLTGDAAIAALDQAKLGKTKDTDLLAVSFSNHDFLSHSFGPNSREVEEMTVAEDREIARLLNEVDKRVGLQNTIVVLTADHGAPPNPDWLKTQKVDAGRVDEKKLKAFAEEFLDKNFGKQKEPWIFEMAEFNIYFNLNTVAAAKVDLALVEQSLTRHFRSQISRLEGITDAYSGSDVRADTLPPALLGRLIRQTYKRGRSGDVVLVPKPYYIVPGATTTHLSGYAYDRMVPLLIAGPQVKSGTYGQKVEIIDIAPTLSFFSGTLPPSGSEGRVLHEILTDR